MTIDLLPDTNTHSSLAKVVRSEKSQSGKILSGEWTMFAGSNPKEKILKHADCIFMCFYKTTPSVIIA